MRGVTTQVVDPRTGDRLIIALIVRAGKPALQVIRNTDRLTATPARLEADARFAELAAQAFGAKQASGLPPAAEAVRAVTFPGRKGRNAPHPGRVRRQAELRELLGEATFQQMVDQLDHEIGVGVSRSVAPPYKPPSGEFSGGALTGDAREEFIRQTDAKLRQIEKRRLRRLSRTR